jgi:hypothetical protein
MMGPAGNGVFRSEACIPAAGQVHSDASRLPGSGAEHLRSWFLQHGMAGSKLQEILRVCAVEYIQSPGALDDGWANNDVEADTQARMGALSILDPHAEGQRNEALRQFEHLVSLFPELLHAWGDSLTAVPQLRSHPAECHGAKSCSQPQYDAIR